MFQDEQIPITWGHIDKGKKLKPNHWSHSISHLWQQGTSFYPFFILRLFFKSDFYSVTQYSETNWGLFCQSPLLCKAQYFLLGPNLGKIKKDPGFGQRPGCPCDLSLIGLLLAIYCAASLLKWNLKQFNFNIIWETLNDKHGHPLALISTINLQQWSM